MITRASVDTGFILVGTLFAIGCSQMAMPPTVPTAASSVQPSGGATGTLRPQILLDDPSLSGTAYMLTDATSSTLTFTNNQIDSFTAPYDNSTTFRRAQLNLYPSDPCRTFAEEYNALTGVATSDGFINVFGGMAANNCNARIVVAPSPLIPGDPYVPPNPVRILSFQPIP